jgi:AcrR family transcriptional regulator
VTSLRPLRRDESQERTRRRLLDAAAALFARDGFRATSLADVAAAAGFSKGAVYSNFASKEHLFLAAIEEEYGASLADLQASLRGSDDVTDRLSILGTWFASNIAGHPQRARATAEFALSADSNPEVRARLAEVRRLLAAAIEGMLVEHQQRVGITFRLPASELAQIVLALVDGLVVQDTFEPVAAARFPAAMALLLAPG